MRLFGILLIVANLLAGAGFVYLSTQDWKGRQSITAAGLRYLLLLKGVPLEPSGPDGFGAEDETPFVFEMGGGETTKTISKKLLEAYFRDNSGAAQAPAGADGPAGAPRVSLAANTPVTNQIAEVKRVQALIKAELAKDGLAPAEKVALLRGWLLYQAESYETRLEYLALTDAKDAKGQIKSPEQLKADAERLEKILDTRFAAVVNRPDANRTPTAAALPDVKKAADELTKLTNDLRDLQDRRPAPEDDIKAKAKEVEAKRTELTEAAKQAQAAADQVADQRGASSLDETERRGRLAHLLIHLDPDAAWQKRIIAVVGLRRYVRAVSLQVSRFDDMIRHVEQAIPGDQSAFIVEETVLRQQATQNAERARAIAEERAKMVEQKTATVDAVTRRRTQLKSLTDQLTKVKAEVDELLVRQTAMEKQLFEVQREVGLTLEDVYRLEALLDAAERERFGLPPRVNP
ncbi:hypothetical protein [Frigoriglobus tundricola]|uniref:Uncharacterized protein n=1 Tax=Frigoriglobus tundricola TaxID=2774151 RepID=A0A6M5YS97_9BACT|nr:hypothetical protein [Frigoriglobus tundricola]QJW96266.1 hypothetical protein FTUN_3823 [Frigoriglobus tundricola]